MRKEERRLIYRAVEEILVSRRRAEAHIPAKFREVKSYTRLSYFAIDVGLRFLTRYGLLKKYREGYLLGEPIKSYFCWDHGYASIDSEFKCSACKSKMKRTHYEEVG